MGTKTIEFELPGYTLDLDLDYDYSYLPAYTNGLPENCYPAEEDCEIRKPSNTEALIDAALAELKRVWMSEIDDQIIDMEYDNAPRDWEREERDGYYDSAAD